MPQSRLGVLVVPPGGHGLAEALRALVGGGAVVTSWSDPLLVASRAAWTDGLDGSIFTWGDWVRRVAQYCGLTAPRIPTQGHQRALVSLAANHVGQETAFHRTCRLPGAHPGLVSVLSELRSWSLDAPKLQDAAEAASPELADRLRALATLDELVRDSLDGAGMGFAGDLVQATMKSDPPQAWPCSDLVLIAGPDPHPVYEAYLAWLAASGLNVSVVVEAVPGSNRLFAASNALIGRLRAKAKPGLGPSWHNALFSGKPAVGGPKLISLAAPDRLSEAEWALRLSVVEEFADPAQTTIVATDIGAYGPLVQASSRRLGVPISASFPAPLASAGFVKFVTGLLTALSEKSAFALSQVAAEDYLGASGKDQRAALPPGRWEDAMAWAKEGAAPPWIQIALAWSETAPDRASLREWHGQLHQLVGDLLSSGGPDGPLVEGERDMRAMTLVQRAIAEYAFAYDLAGEAKLNLTEFLRLAKDLWDAETVVQPSASGGVPLVSSAWAVGAVETVVALGCVEGSFPKGAKQDPVLLDTHREELGGLTNCFLLTSHDASRAERDAFVRLCGSARTSLVLSRPKRDADRSFVPSLYVLEAQRTLEFDEWEPPGLALAENDALLHADIRLAAALGGPKEPLVPPTLRSSDAREAVAAAPGSTFTLGELGDYVRCPLRAAFRHRLSVRQRSRLSSYVLLDIPVRAGLPGVEPLEEAGTILGRVLEQRLEELAPRAMPHEMAMLRAVGKRWIERWVSNEALARRHWPRGEVEQHAEFGNGRLRGTFPIAKDVEVTLSGKVGSIVEADGTVRVVVFRRGETTSYDSDEERATDEVQRAAIALATFRKGDATAFEMDYLEAGRSIEPFSNQSFSQLDRGRGYRVKGPRDTDLRGSLQAAGRQLREVVDNMRVGALRAQPGQHCRTCGITEVCRWSLDEQESRFQGGRD